MTSGAEPSSPSPPAPPTLLLPYPAQDQKYRDIFVLENAHRLLRDLPRGGGEGGDEELASAVRAELVYEERAEAYVCWIADCQLGALLRFKAALTAQVVHPGPPRSRFAGGPVRGRRMLETLLRDRFISSRGGGGREG